LDLIECCLEAANVDQLLADHSIDSFVRISTEPEPQMSGDAYSETITMRISGENCCELGFS
jgi:hypothetical protein